MAITDNTVTATSELAVTNGDGGPVFADIIPAGNKAYIMGKVGIGALNPVNMLDVEGAMAVGVSYSGSFSAPGNGLIVEGNVGVGTNTPMAKLEVVGTLRASQDAYLATASGSVGIGIASPSAKLEVAGALKVSQDVYLATSSGSVGIGTASPMAKLQVVGGALMPSIGNTASAGIAFPPNPGGGAGDAAWMRYYVRAGESTTLEIGISNDLDDHIALMASGNVGIGTLSPVNKLDVSGDVALNGKHALRANDSWLRLNQDGAFTSGVHTPGVFAPMSLNVGGASNWGNPGSGNVWITGAIGAGTTAPARRLHVHSDTWSAGAEIHASGATAGFSFTDREANRQWDNGGPGERWVLYSTGRNANLWTSGNGDLLTVTPDGDLHMRNGRILYNPGRMHIHGEEILYLLNKSGVIVSKAWGGNGNLTVEGSWVTVNGAGGEQSYIGGDGWGNDVQIGSNNPGVMNVGFWNAGTGTSMNLYAKSFVQSSDVKLKTNIEPISSALDKVLKLRGVKFDWADDAHRRKEGKRVGLIAQEVLSIVPEAVSKDSKGMYGITYGPLVSILIEAIKEQNARLERLEAAVRPAESAGPGKQH